MLFMIFMNFSVPHKNGSNKNVSKEISRCNCNLKCTIIIYSHLNVKSICIIK